MQLLCTMLTGSYLDTETPFLQTYSISPLFSTLPTPQMYPPARSRAGCSVDPPDQYYGSSLLHGCGLVNLLVYEYLQ